MSKSCFPILAGLLTSCVFLARVSQAEPASVPSRPDFDRARAACINVLVHGRLMGSGCLIDADGGVLTVAHLLGRPKKHVEVLMADDRRFQAEVVAVNLGNDLALLKLPEQNEAYPFLPVAKEAASVADRVYLIGAPVFRRGLVLQGVVAGDQSKYEFAGNYYIEGFHITGPGPHGSSGGPWINTRGEVVGVQTSSVTIGNAPQGIAISATLAAIRSLVATRTTARTPTLGTAVEDLWGQEPAFLANLPAELDGIVLRQVQEHGPVWEAGLEDWQIVTRFDGQLLRSSDQIVRCVRRKAPGDQVTLRVMDSDGQNPREVTLRLICLEAEWETLLGGGAQTEERGSPALPIR